MPCSKCNRPLYLFETLCFLCVHPLRWPWLWKEK